MKDYRFFHDCYRSSGKPSGEGLFWMGKAPSQRLSISGKPPGTCEGAKKPRYFRSLVLAHSSSNQVT